MRTPTMHITPVILNFLGYESPLRSKLGWEKTHQKRVKTPFKK